MSLIFIFLILYFISKIKYLNISTFFTECNYLIRFIYFPILLSCLYCYFDDKKFSKDEIEKLMLKSLMIYTIFLFIPLITNTFYSSYGDSILNLKGNTGWFYSANEVSIILILIFPYLYTILKNKKSLMSILFGILVIFTISTIGTKASMVGTIITSVILLIISCFYKKEKKLSKKLILFSIIILISIFICFRESSTIDNFNTTLEIQEEQNELIEQTEEQKNSKVYQFLNKYGKTLLSDRDVYVKYTAEIYEENYNINTLLFGLGNTNNKKINNYNIQKLIEIDPLDLFFHSGLIALIIILLPFIYYLYQLIKKAKINTNLIFYTLMIGMIFCVSCISGHTLMAPAVSIYIVVYFLLAFAELDLINKKSDKIKKGKVIIYALHLNYGGVEKNICTKANILSKLYNVEIISLYKLTDKPVFKLDKKVKVKYLTDNIKPNREEFKKALKEKNVINIIKEGLYAIKVLYLKDTLITKSMINCNSEIIISTRIDFTKKLINNNEYKNIKIAEEHIYHNNDKKYLRDITKILKKVDYLMPSSNYLTNYYKELNNKYSYKIITNNMPIESDNSISNLKNKNIISVGRLDKVKGYNDLINIFTKIYNKEWTLNIVGDGPEFNNLNNQIIELGLENNVKLLGFKNTDELNRLYKESSIYIMTSLEESFGLVLLEAASHGLPIIAYSSALGAKEILKDGNGILVSDRNETEMINKLKDLMSDIKLRKEYQKKSLSIAKDYSYEIIEETNIDFYQNITKTNIYNSLYKESKEKCYKLIEENLKNKEKTFIVTANPETYMLSEKDAEINSILFNKENLIVPDGIAIVKTANYLGYDIKERITGVDLAEYLLSLANKNKYKVYLFGASSEVMEKLENVIETKYPNIKLVGSTNGYVKDKNAVMEYIKTTKPDIVMLALGIPMQEKLINKHINDFKKGIFIGVGGSFDVLSGSKKRAPKIFIKLNLEWLYRIMCEPKRITRFIKHNLRFIIKIIKEKWNN